MYDLTITANAEEDGVPVPEETVRQGITQFFVENCKKWCFQLEKGKSGYEHYQGRISLKERKRLNQVVEIFKETLPGAHWSLTSVANRDNNFYVMKAETRIDGPWTNEDVTIPSHLRDTPTWYPWQKHIVDRLDVKELRDVNIIIDHIGNQGCGR